MLIVVKYNLHIQDTRNTAILLKDTILYRATDTRFVILLALQAVN